MKKTYTLGKVDYYGDGEKSCLARLEWEFENGCFSMSGEVWNPKKTDIIIGGQCVDEVVEYFPDDNKAHRMLEVWKRWHLNDMRAGCEHQRADWDFNKELTLYTYGWSPRYYQWMQAAESGRMAVDQYATFKDVAARVNAVLYGGRACHNSKFPNADIELLIAKDWLILEKTETKKAGWVNQDEHPDGLLEKPCAVCGYKYGTAWLKEEIPADVVSEIESW